MSKKEIAQQLRSCPTPCNCCQAVLVTYAEECGLTEEKARDLGAFFMGGMRIGSTCGAVTGGLMALGMMQAGDDTARAFLQQFRQKHGATECPQLLALSRQKGNTDHKAHCNSMIYDAVEWIENR